jgi:starch phosphorylase
VGAENIFIFGMTTEEVIAGRARGYSPSQVVAANAELKHAIDTIDSGYFTPDNIFDSKVVTDRLMSDGEHFMVLADFDSYAAAQERVDSLFATPEEWTRKSVINALSMGPFSSDRSIREYADTIWNIKPVI